MPPFVQGLIVVVLSAIGYVWAFRLSKHNRNAPALVLLMGAGLLLRLYAASDNMLHEWDERYHALVAKHLMQHFLRPTLYDQQLLPFDYQCWTNNGVWLHKQPMALWLIAISLKIFGCYPWVVRLPSVILSTIGIKLMYDIAKQLYNSQTAFVAAFLYSIHGLIIELSAGRTDTDHIDAIFLFFVTAGLWAVVKYLRSNGSLLFTALVGAFMGMAVLTKWLPGLVVFPFWLGLVYKRYGYRKLMADGCMILAVGAAIALPWQWYILRQFPLEANWEFSFNKRHFGEVLEGHSGGFWFHLNQLRIIYGELVYLPVGWYFYRIYKERRRTDIVFAGLFAGVYLFYSIAATKMPAYTIIAAPAIFIITAEAFFAFRQSAKSPGFMKMIAWFLLILPIRYSIERLKPFNEPKPVAAWVAEAKKLDAKHLNTANTVVFNCPDYIEMMFATNCICYEQKPSEEIVRQLSEKGFTVVVLP